MIVQTEIIMAKYNTKKDILITQNGIPVRIKAGSEVELHPSVAEIYLAQGAIERYATKVIRQDPLPHAGVDTQSSALPAVEALLKTTSKPVKRGGRPKKARS